MQSRLPVFILALAALVLAVLAWRRFTPCPPVEPAAALAPTKPYVEIEDGKTIDFSSGRPVVTEAPEEKAALDAALKEIEAATQDLRFAPSAPPVEHAETAEPKS